MCEKLANVGELGSSLGVCLPAKPNQFGYIFIAIDLLISPTC